MKFNILTYVLEDNELLLKVIEQLLKQSGVEDYRLYNNPKEFINGFNEDVHVCIIDYHLPGMTGLEVVEKSLLINPRCKAIMISTQESLDIVIEALNVGVYKYIKKNDPYFHDKLVKYVRQAIERINHDLVFYHALKEKLHPREQSNNRDNCRQDSNVSSGTADSFRII